MVFDTSPFTFCSMVRTSAAPVSTAPLTSSEALLVAISLVAKSKPVMVWTFCETDTDVAPVTPAKLMALSPAVVRVIVSTLAILRAPVVVVRPVRSAVSVSLPRPPSTVSSLFRLPANTKVSSLPPPVTETLFAPRVTFSLASRPAALSDVSAVPTCVIVRSASPVSVRFFAFVSVSDKTWLAVTSVDFFD